MQSTEGPPLTEAQRLHVSYDAEVRLRGNILYAQRIIDEADPATEDVAGVRAYVAKRQPALDRMLALLAR